ncbi:MAG: type VI secretion system baseplate subunit TssF [Pseudomonadota bacterium]
MSDELLPYYEKELAFIRQLGAEFAKEHPKIAGRLNIGADATEDPHVSRLIESFAYLNARIQHKLDDDFPELSDALLGVLFPHYQQPIPSMSIAQFIADSEQLDSSYTIAKHTLLQTEQFQNETCRFSTAYETELLPMNIVSASIFGRPFSSPGSSKMQSAGGVLKLSLQTFTEDIHFSDLRPNKLRFYLKGEPQHIQPLYQLLLNGCEGLVMVQPELDTSPVYLDKDCIQAVGFGLDENLLPYPETSFIGYRLLTEYFIFYEKFMFIDIVRVDEKVPNDAANKLDLYFYLKESTIELEHNISGDNFLLGCTPIVNIFEHKADPIKLDHSQQEYQIIADARRPKGYEVYSIKKVLGSSSSGEKQEYLPFYGLSHSQQDKQRQAFWLSSRKNAKHNNYHRDDGTDVFINLVDLQFNPNTHDDQIIIIDTLCSNRDQPAKLPFNLNQPQLQCIDGSPPCARIRCVTKPTNTVRPPLRNHARWRLISHLNLNYLSICGNESATDALKAILSLYDFKESAATKAIIESIDQVSARPISAPMTVDGRTTICRGIEIEVTMDEMALSGSSGFLFSTVLENFFSLYCSINSFSRLLVKVKNKEGYLKKCPPRTGEKILL